MHKQPRGNNSLKNVNYIVETKPKKSWKKIIINVVVAGFIFYVGFSFGSGRFEWRSFGSVNKNLPAQLNYSSVNETYNVLRKNFDGQLDEKTLLDGIKKGLVEAAGDPYTEYFNEKQAQEFEQELDGKFSGIGAELGKDKESIIIVAPLKGYPADKAGLKPKDIIVEIDGKSAYGMTISDAVSKIRGPVGTKVKLRLLRDQNDVSVEITREEISIPSVEYEIKNNNLGYIRISRFSDDTATLTKKAADEFKSKNVKGVVLDLRGNPGGLLEASVDVASQWLPPNSVVLQEKRAGVLVKEYRSRGTPVLLGVPTYVLVDGGSASASEIVSGALKDNNVAKLIGEKTYGKGSVQTVENLSGNTAIKVTIARWYTPNGQNIDKQGITPNIEVKPSKDSDNQLRQALDALK